MRGLFPHQIESTGKRRTTAALTILEMLVSTAMLSFIILGLTAMFVQTQKAFKTGIKASTITDAGRTITDMIAADMRNMSDGNEPGITNLYWSWSQSFVQSNNGVAFRTNEVDAIYLLEHTNTIWMGVGYAVQNLVPNTGQVIGSLYRYESQYNTPYMITNVHYILFTNFIQSVAAKSFTNVNYWHRVADGVISLKLRAYDQNGNEPWIEWSYNGDAQGTISYPLLLSNTLPNAVDVELAILEPDALARAQALANNPNLAPFNNFMSTNALTTMEIFRRRVSIPVVAR